MRVVTRLFGDSAGRSEESSASLSVERYGAAVHYIGAPRVSCSRRSAYGYRSPLRELIGFGVELLIRPACIQAIHQSHVHSREDSPDPIAGKSPCSMITYYTAPPRQGAEKRL